MIRDNRHYVQGLPVSLSQFGEFVLKMADSLPLNPLSYSKSVSAGVAMIQSRIAGSTIGDALPCHIYIPAGTHVLSSPITITRHNVTLTVDGGARIIPPANQAAIVIDGTQTPETNIKNWGIYINGVIWPSSVGGSSQHGIVLRHAIHGTLFANEIRALGGSGIVFDGNNFSNDISFNRVHGCAGWGITNTNTIADAQPYQTANLLKGEIQSCTLGGANLFDWFDANVYLRVENLSGGVDGVVISDSRNIQLSGYWENPLNTTGNDIKITGVTIPSEDIVLDHIGFYTEKTATGYNINIVAGTSNRITLRHIRAGFITALALLVGGGGNTAIVKYPECYIDAGAVTNNASTQYKSVTAA